MSAKAGDTKGEVGGDLEQRREPGEACDVGGHGAPRVRVAQRAPVRRQVGGGEARGADESDVRGPKARRPVAPEHEDDCDCACDELQTTRAAYAELLRDADYQAAVTLRRAALSEAVMLPMDDWPGR